MHASSSGKVALSTYDEPRMERFLREPLARLTPSTITTRRALRRELAQVRARYWATVNVSGLSRRFDERTPRVIAERLRGVVDDIESALRRGARGPLIGKPLSIWGTPLSAAECTPRGGC